MEKRVRNSLFISVLLTFACCSTPPNKATVGALTGGALGAGLGAIVGNQTGNAGAGVAVGSAAGAVTGALVGNAFDWGDQDLQAQRDRLNQQQSQIEENQRLLEELKRRGADVRETKRGVVINLPDILFEFDRANLTREAQRTLNEIGDVLRDVRGRPIAVEGHTDSIGTVMYNQRLSERRAGSVVRALESQGVIQAQMKIRGYGEGAPIATNNSDMGRARNRRVEVIIEN